MNDTFRDDVASALNLPNWGDDELVSEINRLVSMTDTLQDDLEEEANNSWSERLRDVLDLDWSARDFQIFDGIKRLKNTNQASGRKLVDA